MTRMRTAAVAALALGFAAGLFAQSPVPTPAPAPKTFSIVGATIHPVSGPDIPSGTIVVRDGKIVSVAAGSAPLSGAPVVDAAGRHVYPSLFPPLTGLGLSEIANIRATVDQSEVGDLNPDVRASVAVNFDSELLPVARSGGILVAGVSPTGGLVSGAVAAMKMEGWTREDATLKDPAAITVQWPELAIDRSPAARVSAKAQEKERDEKVEKLKNVFRDAKAYAKAMEAAGQPGVPRHAVDVQLTALVPAVQGRIPVVVVAQRLAQIRDAVQWGKEEGLRIVIWGGADAWRMADDLAKAQVAVVVDSPMDLPRRDDEPYDTAFANAGKLARAGVTVLFNDGGDDPSNVRHLPHDVATAVAFGFPREKAVAAMTLEPAKLLGVGDRVGSLEAGKDATFILTDGDVLDLRSRVVGAYLDGRALDLTDKQKRLYEKYRNRPTPAANPTRTGGGR
jgi:imidazolonepropionase-like amidohydrolase